MNQIPNIEETHNTREVEEKKYPSHKELDMEKYYRIVKSGSFDNMFNYGFEVGKAFHQQELQKAREEERERIRQTVKYMSHHIHGHRIDTRVEAFVELMFKDMKKQILEALDHSELDQDVSK